MSVPLCANVSRLSSFRPERDPQSAQVIYRLAPLEADRIAAVQEGLLRSLLLRGGARRRARGGGLFVCLQMSSYWISSRWKARLVLLSSRSRPWPRAPA
jgi:hypothetical protein